MVEVYSWIDFANPLDGEHPEEDEYHSGYYHDLVHNDLNIIENCDGLLYMYEDGVPQVGSSQEQFYAYYLGIPVVVIYDGDPADASPFLWEHCDCIVPTMEEAAERIEELIAQMRHMAEDPSLYLKSDYSSDLR